MKSATTLLLFLLSCVVVHAATITSAQAGTWATTSSWVGGVVPGDGDTAIIAHDILINNSPVTIGTSGVAGTAAITIQSTGSLSVGVFPGGATVYKLIVRGDIVLQNNSGGALAVLAKSQILFDDTATVSGNESYQLITPDNGLGINPPIVVLGNPTNRAKIGVQTGGTYWTLTGTGSNYGLMDAEYCDFEYMGNATNDANSTSNLDAVNRIVNCRFENCGTFRLGTIGSSSKTTFKNNTVTNTTDAGGISLQTDFGSSFITGGGIRLFEGNVFTDKINLYNVTDVTFTQNYYKYAYNTSIYWAWAASSGNFIGNDSSGGGSSTTLHGDETDSFIINWDITTTNPHMLQAGTDNGNATQTISGCVFEAATSNATGDCVVLGSPPSAQEIILRNNIVLPNGGGECTGVGVTQLGNANCSITYENNTHFTGSQGALHVSETYVGYSQMFKSVQGNLFWDTTARGYKVYDVDNVTSVDLIASNKLNYNAGYNLLSGTNGKGYSRLEFSSGTPGDDDVDEKDPQFIDSTRDLASWDASLGGPGTIANAMTEMEKRNDIGFDSRRTVANLIAYIQEGLTPQATDFQGASFDGGDIGAVAVVPAESGFFDVITEPFRSIFIDPFDDIF